MKLKKLGRKGISGISQVLVFVAVLSAGVLVGWYIYNTTLRAVRTPQCVIEDAFVISWENKLYLKIRNQGGGTFTGTISVSSPDLTFSGGTSVSQTIEAGKVAEVSFSLQSAPTSKSTVRIKVTIRSSDGSYDKTFTVTARVEG